MKKQNVVIIGVIAFVIAVVVGYALFSETIRISGTATAKGDFDVEFTSVGTPTCDGYSKECTAANLATISSDKNTLNVTVKNLTYPGAYVKIPVTITNKGSIAAVLESIDETGLTTDDNVKISYTGVAASANEIASNETQNMEITVTWDSNSEQSSEDVSFSIALNYKQAKGN